MQEMQGRKEDRKISREVEIRAEDVRREERCGGGGIGLDWISSDGGEKEDSDNRIDNR